MSRRNKEVDDHKFQDLNKTTLIQEARYFNCNKVNPQKCVHILTKLLYLLNQGTDNLNTQEATNLFFATTKLFQSKDLVLRRLVYLCIRALSNLAKDVIIVTSSLTKDISGNEDLYRSAAIRTLCSITDSTMLQALERYLKPAIVDKNPAVSSAALVSALHLSATIPELLRRWVNEAQEAMNSENIMVPYHALGILSCGRSNDRVSKAKLITKLVRTPLQSPYALCLLIRHAAKLIEEDPSETTEPCVKFIESCMRHKSEIVIYEAAHAIVILKKSGNNIIHVISVFQTFCRSSKATLRLAGVRILAKLTENYPNAVASCTIELENLVTDSNPSVATLAVTTLLATCVESSIDKLIKKIPGFMSDISDEFKILVVHALKRLSSKYPRKHNILASYLSGLLRDNGGLQYKTAIVNTIIGLVEENPDARETGLLHLCEFIEDCEYTSLAIKILHILSIEGPKSNQPSRYIRYIYNRIFLDTSPVRVAAVSAVARFGATCPDLLTSIKVILSRFHLDDEDEVRDRAIFYSAIINSEIWQLLNDYIINVPLPNPVILEKVLCDHLLSNNADEPFNFTDVPTMVELEKLKKESLLIEAKNISKISQEEQYLNELKDIPGIEKFGVLFKTCKAIELTEPETEYRVTCIKHIFPRHLILRFECLNTLSDQVLQNVNVHLKYVGDYKILGELRCSEISYNKQGNIFCFLEFPENLIESLVNFVPILQFSVRDCDSTSGLLDYNHGYNDTYNLEEVGITVADQFHITTASDEWEAYWDKAASAAEACDTFNLAESDAEKAALAVCAHLGLSKTSIEGDTIKQIRGGGSWREGTPILFKTRLATVKGTVAIQFTTRSPREDIATLLLVSII